MVHEEREIHKYPVYSMNARYIHVCTLRQCTYIAKLRMYS